MKAQSIKILGRRPSRGTWSAADRLMRTVVSLRGSKPFMPKGGYRFRSFEAAQQWAMRMMARSAPPVPRRANEEQAAPGAAFTIIELLIVISIIAILLGIALPSFLPLKDIAKQRKAVITAKHLELAFSEYYNQNQIWPPGGGGMVKGQLLSALTGANAQGIAYFEIGTNTADTFFDPWGDNFYQAAFDNFDNKAQGPDGAWIRKSVIVWNLHTNRNRNPAVVITNKSWE